MIYVPFNGLKEGYSYFEKQHRSNNQQDHHLASFQENLTLLLGNNKGTDQPVHLHSLICAFVIHFL